MLQVNSALHRVDRAGELNQHAVAGDLEDPAPVEGDQRLQHFFPAGLERRECTSLVLPHQAAVADYICGQDRGEAASRRLLRHTERPPMLLCRRL